MKIKNLFKLFLLCTFFLLLIDSFARAGGGHGGGGHGSGGGHSRGHGTGYGRGGYYSNSGTHITDLYSFIMITLVIVTLVVGGTIPTLLKLKSSLSAKVLTHAAHKDTFWEATELKIHARNTFYKMQQVWQNRALDPVQKLITPELYAMHKTMLNAMIKRREKNMLSRIDITTTEIIGCEDHEDDSKDRYVAYIKGTMLDYVIHEPTGNILVNQKKVIQDFCDTYYFVRSNNQWLLEKIDNTVSMLDIIRAKNHLEK